MKKLYKFPAILALLFLCGTTTIQGATITWLGTVSTSWNDASNWNSGVPDSTDDLIIASNAPYNLTLTQNRRVNSFTIGGDTLDLGTYTLTTTGVTYFNGGKVLNGNLNISGSLCHFGGAVIDARIEATCGYYHMNGGIFLKPVILVSTGAASTSGSGNCVFEDSLSVTNNGSYYFYMGSTYGDSYTTLTITNNSTHEVFFGSTDTTFISGNLILNNTSTGGIVTGTGNGLTYLSSGKTITIGSSGFTNNYLTLKNFYQQGSTSQTLTLTGTAILNLINANFEGNLTVTTPGILLKNSTFNGTTSITRNGTSGSFHCDGGNLFTGPLTLTNSATSGRLRMANTTPDTYLGNVTFNSTSGQDVQIGYTGNNIFEGNITINSNKVVFNTASGKVTFTGGNSQTLNGSYNFPFKKLAIDKSSNHVTANTTLSVDDSLIFVSGNLITTSSNLLTMKLSSKVTGASNASFVDGPVKKTGNTAFVYPVGKKYSYRPIEISAPSTSTSEFTGEFISDTIMANTGSRDTTLGYLERNNYWKLNRNSGTSPVYITLSWDSQNSLVDTFVSVASWNGSQWKDLGKQVAIGSSYSGTVKSNTFASDYNEFAIAYQANSPRTASINCSAISGAVELQACLISSGGTVSRYLSIAASFSLDEPSVNLPLIIESGVTLQGYVGGVATKWWETDCPELTSSHTFSYFDATCNCSNPPLANCSTSVCQPQALYLFVLQTGATIQNLRIRGANCNAKDYNDPEMLCGGIYVYDTKGSLDANIFNCEISCFSQAGIWKDDEPEKMNIENCYIHKVKGKSKYGIGYGVWTQSLYSSTTPQLMNFRNSIFDDCKTAIDGQAKIINWNILNCSLTQFFSSEDINMHNDNRFTLGACPCSTSTPLNLIQSTSHYFYDYQESTYPQNYYGAFWDLSVPCEKKCLGVWVTTYPGTTVGTLSDNLLSTNYGTLGSYSVPQGIPLYDIGGCQTTIQNCIFHKKWTLDGGQSNINLTYPNLDPLKGGDVGNFVKIENNTFVMEEMSQAKLDVLNLNPNYRNRGGFARISDNSINADVWSGDIYHIVHNNNNFSYVPGTIFSNSPMSCSNEIELTSTGNVILPHTLTKSANTNQPFIQYVDLGTSFKINTTSDAVSPSFIIRPNPNVNTLSAPLISNENYFYDKEIITSSTSNLFYGYDKPGLYGIDVLAFDVEDVASGTPEKYNFRASSWHHIPVIVKGATEQTLYFNIKDSYLQSGTPTRVWKQAYINDHKIWEEDIADGGEGWEYVEVDLSTAPILAALHTDGTPNILSFSIFMEDNIISTDVAGVTISVDNIYIPVTGSANGDNLVKDGTCELTETPCGTCDWFINASGTSIATGTCGSTAVGINGNEKRSGSNAIYMIVPFEEDCNYNNVISPGKIVASIGTYIDFTDLLSCSDYANLGFITFPAGPYKIDLITPANSNPLPNTNYYVGNNITITGTDILNLENCQLAIASSKTIYVENGGTLIINDNSRLFACDDMWNGIVSTNGIIEIKSTVRTRIEDAITAFDCDGGRVEVRYVDFKDNYKAFNLHESSFGFHVNSFIRGCTFKISNGILSKEPKLGKIPEEHVKLQNLGAISNTFQFPIGGTVPAFINSFSDAFIGIYSINSNVTIKHNKFENIHNRLYNSSLVVNNNNNFGAGILVYNIHTSNKITNIGGPASSGEDNEFINVNIGIKAVNRCNSCSLNVSHNSFDNTNYGNIGIGTSFYNTAITVQSVLSLTGTIVEIHDNTILNNRIGIHALNVPEINIGTNAAGTLDAGNSIQFNKTIFPLDNFYEGIWLQNCTGAKVANNSVINSTENEDLNFRGLDIETSADCFLNCNDIDKIGVAINIYDNCGTTKLRSNTMSNFFTGVWLNGPNGASIDVDQGDDVTQESWGNVWNWDAAPSLKVDGGGYAGVQTNWYHENADASSNPLSPRPWNSNIVQPIYPKTDADDLCISFFRTTPNRQDNFGPVVGDSAVYTESEDKSRYLATQTSYIAMKNDSTLIYRGDSLDTDFESFFLRMDSSNVGKFQKVRALSTTWPDSAKAINSAIVDTNDIEYNLKSFNALYFDKLIDGTPINSTDSTFLDGLLNGSAITEGESFYYAAAVQFREMHPESYSLRLGNTLPPETVEQPPVQTNIIKIFPNPVSNNIKVEVLDPDDKIIRIELYSSLGNLIKSKSCNSDLIELDVQTYIEGLYKLRAFTIKGFSDTKTFSIVR